MNKIGVKFDEFVKGFLPCHFDESRNPIFANSY